LEIPSIPAKSGHRPPASCDIALDAINMPPELSLCRCAHKILPVANWFFEPGAPPGRHEFVHDFLLQPCYNLVA